MMRNAARSVTRGVNSTLPGTIVEFMSEMAEIPYDEKGGIFASLEKNRNDLAGGASYCHFETGC